MQQTGKLSAKLVGIQVFFLAVALVSIGLTLLVSWRLEGSAAAINDAGSLRMRTYRLAYLAQEARPAGARARRVGGADPRGRRRRSRRWSRRCAPATPRGRCSCRAPTRSPRSSPSSTASGRSCARRWCAPPTAAASTWTGRGSSSSSPSSTHWWARWSRTSRRRRRCCARSSSRWSRWRSSAPSRSSTSRSCSSSGRCTSSRTACSGWRRAISTSACRSSRRTSSARWPRASTTWPSDLQESYRTLERRVADKTQSLAQQNARLATLYDMTALLNAPSTQEDLCRGFLRRLLPVAGAAAGAVRLMSPDGGTLHLFVEDGLRAGVRRQGTLPRARRVRLRRGRRQRSATVIHVLSAKRTPINITLPHCREAGFATVAAFPIAAQQQVLGIFNLFYRERTRRRRRGAAPAREPRPEPRRRDREPAPRVARTRTRDRRGAQPARPGAARLDRAVARLPQPADADAAQGAGGAPTRPRPRGSWTRSRRACRSPTPTCASCWCTSAPGSPTATSSSACARCSTRFQHQTGIAHRAPGDRQRGAARARRPAAGDAHPAGGAVQRAQALRRRRRSRSSWQRGPGYSFAVRDDGRGFDPARPPDDAADHVGLRIMRERARRIGAQRRRALAAGRAAPRCALRPAGGAARGRVTVAHRAPPRRHGDAATGRSASSSSTTTRCSGAASPRCSARVAELRGRRRGGRRPRGHPRRRGAAAGRRAARPQHAGHLRHRGDAGDPARSAGRAGA